MQFLKNSHHKISPIQFKIESLPQNNLNQLLINYLKTRESGSVLFILLIIIGIGIGGILVFAPVLSSLLGCGIGNPIRTEGINNVATMIKVQKAYHLERNKFASNLAVTLPTQYYNNSIEVTDNEAYSFAIPKDAKYRQRVYTGAIFFLPKEKVYLEIICRGDVAGIKVNPNKPILKNGELSCPKNMTVLK